MQQQAPLPTSPVAPELVVLDIPAEPSRLHALRESISRWLDGFLDSETLHGDIVLAAYEAMANVVAHAYPDGPGVFDLRARADADIGITIVILDHGRWESTRRASLSHGRGLPLIEALTGRCDITTDTSGTRVRLWWPHFPTR